MFGTPRIAHTQPHSHESEPHLHDEPEHHHKSNDSHGLTLHPSGPHHVIPTNPEPNSEHLALTPWHPPASGGTIPLPIPKYEHLAQVPSHLLAPVTPIAHFGSDLDSSSDERICNQDDPAHNDHDCISSRHTTDHELDVDHVPCEDELHNDDLHKHALSTTTGHHNHNLSVPMRRTGTPQPPTGNQLSNQYPQPPSDELPVDTHNNNKRRRLTTKTTINTTDLDSWQSNLRVSSSINQVGSRTSGAAVSTRLAADTLRSDRHQVGAAQHSPDGTTTSPSAPSGPGGDYTNCEGDYSDVKNLELNDLAQRPGIEKTIFLPKMRWEKLQWYQGQCCRFRGYKGWWLYSRG